ncbi:MAG: protein kinase [Pirellula sp.]
MSWQIICPSGHSQFVHILGDSWPFACSACSTEDALPPPPQHNDLSHVRGLVRAYLSPNLESISNDYLQKADHLQIDIPVNPFQWKQQPPEIDGFDQLEEIGRGGMGVVYRARQRNLDRIVALKLILAGPQAREEEHQRLRAEATAAARVRHPNIVQIYEVAEHAGCPFLVLEYVEGGSLAEHIKGKTLSGPAAANLVATLADAIHAAHIQGIVHRDLKPGNILLSVVNGLPFTPENELPVSMERGRLTSEFFPKITDFGLAKQIDGGSDLTGTGQVIGTPNYMAPEQASGLGKAVGPAADVYALGAILYELLTGRPPFKAAGFLETLEQVRRQDPLPPGKLQPGLPSDLQTICLKCLEKEPRRRYDSADALSHDLRCYLRGEPIAARPVSSLERLIKWSRRKPSVAALFAVTCLGLVGSVFGVLAHNARLRVEVQRATSNEVEAKKQSRRADANYREARETLNGILNRFEGKRLADVPRLKELRRDVLENALAFYQRILQETDQEDPAVRLDTALALEQTSQIQATLGRTAQAKENVRKAIDHFDQLTVQRPNDTEVVSHLATCLSRLGLLTSLQAGPSVGTTKQTLMPDDTATLEKAESYLRRAIQLREHLHQAEMEESRWKEELAATHIDLSNVLTGSRKMELASQHIRTALALQTELFATDPTNISFAVSLAQAHLQIGNVMRGSESLEKVESHYSLAAKLLEGVVGDESKETDHAILLAQLYVGWGHLLRAQHDRTDETLDLYTRAIRLMNSLWEREPNDAKVKLTLHNAYGGRGYLHMGQERYSESVADWDRVVELSEGAGRAFNRSCRATILARTGDHSAAAAEAHSLVENPEGSNDVLYNAAAAYAVATEVAREDVRLSPDARARLADDYAKQAMAVFQQLQAAGYFRVPEHVHSLLIDNDIDSVRGHDDWKKLESEVYFALSEVDRQRLPTPNR